MKKERVLIIGAGDVARRLIPTLVPRFKVFALTSSVQNAGQLRTLGVIPIIGNLDQRATLVRLAGLATRIFHFAPPPNTGETDPRTRKLLAILARPHTPAHQRQANYISPKVRITYISTTGVYGDCGGARFDETRPVNPQNARAVRRVAAELALRQAGQAGARRGNTGKRLQASILRVPGIYAADRLPLERLRRGTPALCDEEDVFTNHIHADDLARITWHAHWRGLPNRVYHASDDSELKMGVYFDRVADAFGLAHPPRVTRALAQEKISPNLLSFMSESRRLDNTRMKRELGIRLRYPTVDAGLADAARSGSLPTAAAPPAG